ncbi:MAG: sugar transferase [Pirellulales bacterium]
MSQSEAECNVAGSVDQSWQAESTNLELGYACATSGAVAAVAPSVECDVASSGVRPDRVAAKRLHASVCPCPFWKRAIDVGGSIVGLVILSPLLLAVAVLIKSVSQGPVFFRQRRFGAGGRPFILWKFRTIDINEATARHRSHVSNLMDSGRTLQKRDDELAIIWGGRMLRKLGIDELPQLFNVMKGDMSLVGPRPDVLPLRNYQTWQRRRFDVVPGITGLWQVCGKNHTTFSTMMRMDILYVRRRSFWLDMIILLRTIPAVARN